jgi:CubicO group peptidase (beta-lactamase class C family)
VHERKLAGVDAPVKDWWDLSEKDQTMTFRHLADMTSGYDCGEKPGEAWGYNDYGIRLYGPLRYFVWVTPTTAGRRKSSFPAMR